MGITTYLVMTYGREPTNKKKATEEQLRIAVVKSTSYTEVARNLGWGAKRATKKLKPQIESLGIDISHWKDRLWNGAKNRYNTEVFTRSDGLSYYLLGCWVTDGFVGYFSRSYRSSICAKDHDWIGLIRDQISPGHAIYSSRKDSNCSVLVLQNKPIYDWLFQQGCVPRKSLTLKMPNVPDEYFFDFLRGVIDGDGSFCFTEKAKLRLDGRKSYATAIHISTCSRDFASGLSQKLTDMGISNTVCIEAPKGLTHYVRGGPVISRHTAYTVCILTASQEQLIRLMYHNKTILSMPRKKKLARKILAVRILVRRRSRQSKRK